MYTGPMDKTILRAEEVLLTGQDIHTMTSGHVNILPYHMLANAASFDNILGDSGACIILYELSEGSGHWVLVMKRPATPTDPEHIEFFDPLGVPVDADLPRIDAHVRSQLHEDVPHLTQLIRESGLQVVWNRQKLQKDIRHVNTCGRHCVVRWLFRKTPLDRYQKSLTRNRAYDPDFWVSALTLLHSMLG
jgi:hypothetical protein